MAFYFCLTSNQLIWSTNIAMEKHHFQWVNPKKNRLPERASSLPAAAAARTSPPPSFPEAEEFDHGRPKDEWSTWHPEIAQG